VRDGALIDVHLRQNHSASSSTWDTSSCDWSLTCSPMPSIGTPLFKAADTQLYLQQLQWCQEAGREMLHGTCISLTSLLL
jgi:hypothetical protein